MSEAWATRFLKRYGFSLRRATSSKMRDQHDQTRINNQLLRVAQAVAELDIPDEQWILNADETGVLITTASETTFDTRGHRHVSVAGRSQRQQVTVMETFVMDGTLLPRQVIFGGKTNKVHPAQTFEGIHYAHSPSHWSDSNTLVEWFDAVIVPYAVELRTRTNRPNQALLLLLDAYSAHFETNFLTHAAKGRVKIVSIEPGMTDVLQPCDHVCGPNRNIKPVLYRLNDVDYLDFVVESLRKRGDQSPIASTLATFNAKAYNVKLCDMDESNNVVD